MATAIIKRTYKNHEVTYNSDGWLNATDLAEKYGRRLDVWLKTDETQNYIAALCENSNTTKEWYLKTKRGNNGGTWIHPKLAVLFGRWLDVKFAVWCDEQIDSIVRGTFDHGQAKHTAAVSYRVMSDVLHDARQDAGKGTMHYHYANEAKLVNWAVCGQFVPLDRSALSTQELDLLGFLELKNANLICRGLDREKRQEMLKQYAMDWRIKRTPLIV